MNKSGSHFYTRYLTKCENTENWQVDCKDVIKEMNAINKWARGFGKECKILLLKEEPTTSDSTKIWIIEDEGGTPSIEEKDVRWLKDHLKETNGGDRLGTKGLIIGNSGVECFLSKSSQIFPGDADAVCILADIPKAIIEYKSHTIDDEMENHLIERYYPTKDPRKYRSLWILAGDLHCDLFVVYINQTDKKIIIEKIELVTDLKIRKKRIGEAGEDPMEQVELLRKIYEMR